MKTLDEFIAEQVDTDPEFREAWEASRPQYEFRKAVVSARLASGLTQRELADRVGTTQSAISRLEAGDGFPRMEMLFKLARALNVSFEFTPEQTVTAHAAEAVII